MFGALGFRAQKAHMLNTTVAALKAVKGHALGHIFDQVHQQPASRLAVDHLTQLATYMPEGMAWFKITGEISCRRKMAKNTFVKTLFDESVYVSVVLLIGTGLFHEIGQNIHVF